MVSDDFSRHYDGDHDAGKFINYYTSLRATILPAHLPTWKIGSATNVVNLPKESFNRFLSKLSIILVNNSTQSENFNRKNKVNGKEDNREEKGREWDGEGGEEVKTPHWRNKKIQRKFLFISLTNVEGPGIFFTFLLIFSVQLIRFLPPQFVFFFLIAAELQINLKLIRSFCLASFRTRNSIIFDF